MIGGFIASMPALAESGYHPIRPSMVDKTITLTGHDLTIEQLVDVARNGAKVQLSPEAKQRQADNYGLLLEAAAEGIAVYWFNRGAGDQRETIMFSGDPMSPKNKAYLEKSQLQEFRMGAVWGYGPEVDEEEIVRAMMLVRANAMTHNAPSPQLAQMLLDLLNQRITPVVQSRGTLGEGDLAQLTNVGATMVGAGDAYYQGARMSAAEALAKANLKPIQPFAADTNALTSSDAYATGIAALTVDDAQRALDWADLIYAMDLNGMNSSITPLSTLVQRERPFKWLNWDAARVREMIKGSYLFADDPHRIIQDPESLRASSIRQASAWQDWGALRDAVLVQMNSSDHNPAVRTDLSPEDSWEMSTPQMMKFYVKGGKYSNGKHGYIVSNANWDPYPMANKLEDFTIALANMDIAVSLRIDRFFNPFFTLTNPAQVLHLSPGNGFAIYLAGGGGFTPVDLEQEIQSLTNPVAPSGQAIVGTVEDLQAQTRVKAYRARQAVSTTFDLLAHDLLTATLWLDVRKSQDPSRNFGDGPTAAWAALRKIVPLLPDMDGVPTQSRPMAAAAFLKSTPASTFFRGSETMPRSSENP
ncbi:MAG TPA: aromatic amino acid ammonia-lyase [Steroidobacteraceae bacterium]|jgi:histidine ammonia-lyase|nr:aromatic amino acid ammonia-lyase [Steroidobacteraceae bacterium]